MTYYVNLLSFSRIALAVVISILLIVRDAYFVSLILFLIAGISDYFDGFFARKYNATSQIGEILDPIADKILIIFILITLSVKLSSFLMAFGTSIIISREIWVSALRDFSARNNILNATKVTYLAKAKTSVQLLTIFIYLFALSADIMILIIIADIFLIISVLVTMYTGYEYTINVIDEK